MTGAGMLKGEAGIAARFALGVLGRRSGASVSIVVGSSVSPQSRPKRDCRRFNHRFAIAVSGVLLLLGLVPAQAWADVFEVGSDGSLARVGGAGMEEPAVQVAGQAADIGNEAVPAALLSSAPEWDVPIPALTTLSPPAMPLQYGPALMEAARKYQVSPDLLAALVWQESRWQPAALSTKGAIGLAQLMPATARALAVEPRDAAANLSGAAHYLRQMLDLFDGDVERALAAYNAGPQRVLKAGGVPPIAETRAYVARIMDRLAATRAGTASGVQP